MPDYDDPFLPAHTTQRPRPGAGRRGSVEPAPAGSEVFTTSLEPLLTAPTAALGIGLNPLVRAASPLLILMGELRGSVAQLDVPALRRQALDGIRHFEAEALKAGVGNEIALAARYAICAGLDEAVLSTPWGSQSEWSQHPLLVSLHREAWGGEKFFEMLDRLSVDPGRYIDLMELQYLILALGFSGKYQLQDRGYERLADLQHALYRKIKGQRGAADPQLSIQWRGLEDRRNRLVRYVPWWVVAAAALAVVGVLFVIYQRQLATRAEPLQARLAQVGLGDFAAPPAPLPPMPGPTLKQLLKNEEEARTMTVVETGRRTVVTLIGSDLFASGSASVNPAYEATLGRVVQALNRVPGRVMVRGHTDDQAIRSLKFQDNVELSRERAVSVANVLKRTIDNPARLTWLGVGSGEPLYRPPSTAENRARNRRVEIVHIRE